MRVFEVKPREMYVSGERKWRLPGVKCDYCGHESGWGGKVQYPTVSLPAGLNSKDYAGYRWVSLAEFRKVSAPIRRLVPPELLLPPGAGFGPFVGDVTGRLKSFAWCMDEVFVTEAALKALRAAGLDTLKAAPAEIVCRRKQEERLVEIQVEPWAHLSTACLKREPTKPCSECGFSAIEILDSCYRWPGTRLIDSTKIRISASSVPRNIHLFSLHELSGVYASEKFVESVNTLGLGNIAFSEVGVDES